MRLTKWQTRLYFHSFIVFIVLFAAFYRLNITIRYMFPFLLGCLFIYYQQEREEEHNKSPLQSFLDALNDYEEYNPQQFQLMHKAIATYEVTMDGTDLLNTFHDFIHTLPLSMVEAHRYHMRRLEGLVERPQNLNSEINEFRYYA